MTDSREAVLGLPKSPADDGKSPVQAASGAPRYAYSTTTACTDSPPGAQGADTLCAAALLACPDPANGPGPLTRIWRQTLQGSAVVDGWRQVGLTCWSNVLPGSRPTLTMAMILQAFHLTPWAKPVLSTQPKGDVTLVNLDTYYQVNWSVEGFQPGESETIDPATMLGYTVEIRPRLESFTYHFGDGRSFGPTPSTGGTYPGGDITHAFASAGAYPSRVDTTFGADFRVNGGQWAPVPATVTVPGPVTTVTVKSARAVLVNG